MGELQKKPKRVGDRFKLVEKSEDGELVLGSRGKAIAGFIAGRQESYQRALQAITDLDIDTSMIQVGDQSMLQLLESFQSTQKDHVTDETVAKIMTEEIQAIFQEEVSFIERELGKFKPAEVALADRQLVQVTGKITKNHTSS